jgi:excisionase family DNA binding protein
MSAAREDRDVRGSKAAPQEEKPVRGQLVTINEAAKYIHLGLTTFYECVRSGKIPYFRPPKGKILLDTADLDDWLRMSKVTAGIVPGDM